MSVETKEVTVQAVLPPDQKIPFARIRTAEEGFISLDSAKDLKEFSVGDVCTITFKVTDKGFKNNGKRVGAGTFLKEQSKTRSAAPTDINWPGIMGMVNQMIGSITDSEQLQFWLNVDPKHIAALIIKGYQAQQQAQKLIASGRSDNPADIMTGKRKQKSEDLADEIPFGPGDDE
jgi:hypothetical protein